jgi:putative tricarboxylic transport membrane protein
MTARLRSLLPYLLVLAAAAVLTWHALHFDFTPRGDRPGPDVWPRAILALLVAACVARIVTVLRRPPQAIDDPVDDVVDGVRPESSAPGTAVEHFPRLVAAGIALTIGYVALLGTLGFFVDTSLYIAALVRTGRYRRWPVIAAVALGGALAFMFVFMKVVYLSLPIGRAPFSAISLLLMQLLGIR